MAQGRERFKLVPARNPAGADLPLHHVCTKNLTPVTATVVFLGARPLPVI